MAQARFAETLRLLAASDVEFIVVGMTAGILQGVPLSTLDVNIVHRRSPENVGRLLRVLREIGDLDCLGTLGDRVGYEELLDRTITMDLGGGMSVRVLTLPALIEAKQRAGRPKDVAALPVLRATLDELSRRS